MGKNPFPPADANTAKKRKNALLKKKLGAGEKNLARGKELTRNGALSEIPNPKFPSAIHQSQVNLSEGSS
jgi:hypothetical protein